jgi:hypothetical protein
MPVYPVSPKPGDSRNLTAIEIQDILTSLSGSSCIQDDTKDSIVRKLTYQLIKLQRASKQRENIDSPTHYHYDFTKDRR